VQSQPETLVADDQELVALADRVNDAVGLRVRLAHDLVSDPHFHVPGDRDDAKRSARRTLERILRAIGGLRDGAGAGQYLDARMWLTLSILTRASTIRGSGMKATPWMARGVATGIASRWPSLSAKIHEPDRVERLRSAIDSVAASAKRTPWAVIASTWDGIEKRAQSPEVWRVQWAKYGRRVSAMRT